MPFDRSMPAPDARRAAEASTEALAELLARVGNERDRNAFSALFSHFAPRLKAFFLKRGLDDATAEDLAQEAMLRIWYRASQFDPGRAAPSAWVFGIARNLRADTLRRRSAIVADLDLPEPSAPERSPEAEAIQAQQETRLREALRALPGPQREAVHAAFLNGMPHSEAHQALGIALGTLKSRLRLGLARLRAVLDDIP
jgi:RNA polymerase sigma-70 factor (ECF subfamily)